MRVSLILLVSLLTSYISIAQNPSGGRPGGANGGQSITGTMYGKIVDGISQKPIGYASVQLLGSKFDSVTKK